MIGPSPDWFTGVSKLNLCQLDCLWKDSYEEDLYLYDAGTDSGTTYMVIFIYLCDVPYRNLFL